MARVLLVAWNDLRQMLRDRPALFYMVALPIGFILLFGSLGSGGGPRTIGLAVADADRSFLSRAFTEALRREGFEVVDAAAASAPRLLSIPAGFADSLAAGRRAPLDYRLNPGADAEASVVAEMHVQRAVVQTTAHLIEARPAVADSASRRLAFDAPFEQRFAQIAAREPRIGLRVETAGRGRPVPSGMRQSLPATIVLFMLINTSMYGGISLVVEKRERLLARMASAPVTRAEIIAGKLAGGVAIALVQAALLLVAGRIFGASLGRDPLGLALVVICFALVSGAVALFWGAVARRADQTAVLALVTSLFLGAIGGCWWPLEVVPSWLQTVGHLSPAAWAMDGLHSLLSFGAGTAAVLLPCAVLLAYAAALFAIAARALRFTE